MKTNSIMKTQHEVMIPVLLTMAVFTTCGPKEDSPIADFNVAESNQSTFYGTKSKQEYENSI